MKNKITLQIIADSCIDITGAAQMLGCSRQAVHDLVRAGNLLSFCFGNDRRHILLKGDVEKLKLKK